MTVDQSWKIPTDDLCVGTPLKFDLVDSDGEVLQKAGTSVDERLKAQLLERNVNSLTLYESVSTDSRLVESVLLSSYPQATVQRILASISTVRDSLLDFTKSLQNNEDGQIAEVSQSVSDFILETQQDVAAVLAVMAIGSKETSPGIASKIVNHSSNLALMSIVMSVARNDDASVTYKIGLAGLLHDCSLLYTSDWFSSKTDARNETARKKYRRHPIDSADMLNGVSGIPMGVLALIMAVHEQADGSGYPRGHSIEKQKYGSEILNLADAYLSLTAPIEGQPWVPADVLAYLCFHTMQGKFCREAMQLMMETLSMYPIGSTVELDDQSKAVVVRGKPDNRLAPVVRSLHAGHIETDLGDSNRFISGPHVSDDQLFQRISKSKMREILWKTDR